MALQRLYWYTVFRCEETDKSCLFRWHFFHSTAIICGTLSIFCVLFMISTAIKYRKYFGKLTFAAQLPIYIGICDLGYECFHVIDHFFSVINGYVMEPYELCAFFGSTKPFWINAQTAWALACAVFLFRTFISPTRSPPTFGPCNVYLHVCCWGIPFISYIIGWALNAYGSEYANCGLVSPLQDFYLIDLWMFLAIITLAIVYGTIVFKMNKTMRQIRSNIEPEVQSESINRSTERMQRALRNIGLYPLAYTLQWFGFTLLKFGWVSAQGKGGFIWLMFVVICTNSGGCFNCMLYGQLLWNQIKRARRKEIARLKKIMSNKNSAMMQFVTINETQSSGDSGLSPISPTESLKSPTESL